MAGEQRESIGAERFFQNALDEGRFLIQRSRGSGAFIFYPRALEPGTGNDDLEWVEASGRGTVHSTTVVLPGRAVAEAYNIALVDLAEGPRMLTRVIDVDPAEVRIGMDVRARIGAVEGKAVVLFVPAGKTA